MSAIRESIKEQSDRLEAGIARVEKLEELLKDVIGEYDRLSGQLSTQIKAVIQLQEDMKS